MNIFSIVLSTKDHFFNVSLFLLLWNSLRRSSPSSSEKSPLMNTYIPACTCTHQKTKKNTHLLVPAFLNDSTMWTEEVVLHHCLLVQTFILACKQHLGFSFPGNMTRMGKQTHFSARWETLVSWDPGKIEAIEYRPQGYNQHAHEHTHTHTHKLSCKLQTLCKDRQNTYSLVSRI